MIIPEYKLIQQTPEYQARYNDMVNFAENLRHMDWEKVNLRKEVILSRNTDVFDFFKHEGYWKIFYNDEFPMPIENSFKPEDKEVFLPKLKWVESQIMMKKNPITNAFYMRFLGYSPCRCCGENNGTGEYYYQGWAWPDGYMHYLEAHNVEPTAAFMVFINSTYDRFHN